MSAELSIFDFTFEHYFKLFDYLFDILIFKFSDHKTISRLHVYVSLYSNTNSIKSNFGDLQFNAAKESFEIFTVGKLFRVTTLTIFFSQHFI